MKRYVLKMMPSERSFIYVFNEGGKFRNQTIKEESSSVAHHTQQSCSFGRHTFRTETNPTAKKRCSGCARFDLIPAARCVNCPYSLCSPCAVANKVIPNRPADSHNNVEEKREDEHWVRRSVVATAPKGLFPAEQTIQFVLLSSGLGKDLAERLTVFVNSKLGAKENQVEHVTAREDIDLAWVVLKTKDALHDFRLKCAGDQHIDLFDGWRAKWKIYLPPRTRRVYRVIGIPDEWFAKESLCSDMRGLIEQQLRMAPEDIDLVVESEGALLVVFTHGEYDVDFTRSVFLPNGHELAIHPTGVSV